MPRQASDREFGFRAPGLARILVASDANEVLTALLTLGIDPTSEEAFEALVEAVVELVAAPVLTVLTTFDNALANIAAMVQIGENFVGRVDETLDIGALRSAGAIASGLVLTTKVEIEALQFAFQERMNDAEAIYPQFVWPATPGVFEEA